VRSRPRLAKHAHTDDSTIAKQVSTHLIDVHTLRADVFDGFFDTRQRVLLEAISEVMGEPVMPANSQMDAEADEGVRQHRRPLNCDAPTGVCAGHPFRYGIVRESPIPRSAVFHHRDDNTDNYLGAEGDVYRRSTGLNWLQGGRLEQLLDLLEGRNTASSQTCLAMLDALTEHGRLEHISLARLVGCTPAQLQSRNGKMTQLIKKEFTGCRWPIGWHRGDPRAGEDPEAWIYELHPEFRAAWKRQRPLTS
jgi:hypothetical protein